MKNYGHVTLEDMHDKEQDLIAMHYDPTSSVDAVFSAVDKFWDLCILTEQPKSDGQLTNISYIIFNKPRCFTDALKLWNKKTENKTYADFKDHLWKEYNNLKQVGALSVQNSRLNPQANNLRDNSNIGEQISANIANDLQNTILDALMSIQSSTTEEPPPLETP